MYIERQFIANFIHVFVLPVFDLQGEETSFSISNISVAIISRKSSERFLIMIEIYNCHWKMQITEIYDEELRSKYFTV